MRNHLHGLRQSGAVATPKLHAAFARRSESGPYGAKHEVDRVAWRGGSEPGDPSVSGLRELADAVRAARSLRPHRKPVSQLALELRNLLADLGEYLDLTHDEREALVDSVVQELHSLDEAMAR